MRGSERRHALWLSYIEGSFFALMVGLGESFSLVFAAEQDFSSFQYGLLHTLPLFLGSLFSAWIPGRLKQGRLKPWIVGASVVQALGLVGIFCCAWFGASFEFLLAALSLYWIGGMVISPLWIDWISAWLPESKLRPFLARRAAFVTALTLLCYVAGSQGLFQSELENAFAWCFGLAALARFISSFYLSRMPNPKVDLASSEELPPALSASSSQWLIALLGICIFFKFSVGIASSYFTPFKLLELQLDIPTFVLLSALTLLARSALLYQWGMSRQYIHSLASLQAAIFGIGLISLAFSVVRSVPGIALLEFSTGIFWGAFDLSLSLILQSSFKGNARRIAGLHLAFMNLSTLGGSMLGGALLDWGWSYENLFMISGGLRLSAGLLIFFFAAKIPDFRVPASAFRETLSATLSVRPAFGPLVRMILPRKKSSH